MPSLTPAHPPEVRLPPVVAPLEIAAGSYDPVYWSFADPDSGAAIDLTAPGFSCSGAIASQPDGSGQTLLALADADFRRTNTGRVYFEPDSTTTAAWSFRYGYYQFWIGHPSGETVRFGEGSFRVSPSLH